MKLIVEEIATCHAEVRYRAGAEENVVRLKSQIGCQPVLRQIDLYCPQLWISAASHCSISILRDPTSKCLSLSTRFVEWLPLLVVFEVGCPHFLHYSVVSFAPNDHCFLYYRKQRLHFKSSCPLHMLLQILRQDFIFLIPEDADCIYYT